MTPEPPLLEVRGLTKVFKVGGGLGLLSRRSVRALDAVSFVMPSDRPTITALVGESGSGKTTLARIILGLYEPTFGAALYKGRDARDWLKSDRESYLRQVQPIFQDPYSAYNPFYRIEHALEVTLRSFHLAPDRRSADRMIVEAMRAIGLRPEDLLGRYPHQLSGGERQRFLLTRILLLRPRLIVADEPASMIDMSLRAIFLEQLQGFREQYGMSCLYITHDLSTAAYLADQIVVLCHGHVVEQGPAREVIDQPTHPYTQLLIESMPTADPRRRWTGRVDLTCLDLLERLRDEGGCIFVSRCPDARKECREGEPGLVVTGPGRTTACYLYGDEGGPGS